MDSWSKCQYCCMLLWSSVTIIKFENHYCYHTQNKSKNNNKFSKNDKKVRTDNFFNQWLWVTQWLSDLQRYCKQTGLALQPAAWHHFKVIPDSSRTIWPALCSARSAFDDMHNKRACRDILSAFRFENLIWTHSRGSPRWEVVGWASGQLLKMLRKLSGRRSKSSRRKGGPVVVL